MFKIRKNVRIVYAVAFLLLSSAFYSVMADLSTNYCRDCGSLPGCYNQTTISSPDGWRSCQYNEETGRCNMQYWGNCSEPIF